MRFSSKFGLVLEDSARKFRPWLRGIHTPCDCAVSWVEEVPLGDPTAGLPVEILIKRKRQMSENGMKDRLLWKIFIFNS